MVATRGQRTKKSAQEEEGNAPAMFTISVFTRVQYYNEQQLVYKCQ